MEPTRLALSAQGLSHVLRHFDAVSPRVADRLRAAGIDDEAQASVLAAPGSRFTGALGDAVDVLALLGSLAPSLDTMQADGSRVLTWELDRARYPEGAGSCGIVSLAALSADERSRVVTEDRLGDRVLVLVRAATVTTWSITAVVDPTSDDAEALSVRTLFPGPSAPPFPGSLPPGRWRDEAEAFWSEHALVRAASAPDDTGSGRA